MKRYLVFGAVLATLLIGVSETSWALEYKANWDYRLRGFYIDNLIDADSDAPDSAAYYSQRFMLTTMATDGWVSGVVTLLAGSNDGTGNRLLGNGETGQAFGPTGASVEVLEAYMKADFKSWDLTAGRAPLKFGLGVTLDDWVDGIWANARLGGTTLTLGTAKLAEHTNDAAVFIGNETPPGDDIGPGDDADLYFINAGLGDMGMASGTNVFLSYLIDRNSDLGGVAGDDATVWMLGASTDLELSKGFRLKGEFDILNGSRTQATDNDIKGYNLVLGAKLDAGLPLGLDLVYTSGDEFGTADEENMNGFSGNYPIGIIVTNSGARSAGVTDGTCVSQGGAPTYSGGSLSCIGGDGLMAIKASTAITHGPHVVDLAAIWAQSTEDPDDTGPLDESIGIELDATFTWELMKNLHWLNGVGYLLAGDYAGTDSDNLTVLVTEIGYKF